MSINFRVAADIGGTFTDVIFQDIKTGQYSAVKILSTPENPAVAVLEGIDRLLPDDGAIDHFVHGTTVGLNALLTRKGAKVALLTTENFRDIYTIQGNDRGEIFSIRWNKPKPLTPLEDTYTARERIAATGDVVIPLNLGDLDELVEKTKEKKYEAIAIAFLFSFKNPSHELSASQYLHQRLPGVEIAMSHRVSSEWREFDRTSTTVMDSYLAPVVRTYLNTLVSQLKSKLPVGRSVFIMQSNGGLMTASSASETPLQTLWSGPVGGATGGKALSAVINRPNLICVDMGGTSFDASLIIDGKPSTSNETKFEGLPVQMSVVDIHVIGAGGGSIAWQEAGAIRVGPQSAGANPGPVCYGLGGTDPTVSDANLILGRLDSSNFAGKGLELDLDTATRSIESMGKHFELSATEMAQGIVDIINAKMADAIRTITVQRGIDPRDFSLLAFGGAGPAQAASIAEDLEIAEVIVPVQPGAFSAWGMLQTDIRRDFKETLYGFWDAMDARILEQVFHELEAKGRNKLASEGVDAANISFERGIDFRYFGQEYVLTIPVPNGPLDMKAIRTSFDKAYDRQYGHSSPENRIEMANVRLAAVGYLPKPPLAALSEPLPGKTRVRDVYFDGETRPTIVYDRETITSNDSIIGPAIIEETTATTLVPPGWHAKIISGYHLVLTSAEKK